MKKKRFLALLLFAAMFIQMLPAAAFAAGTSQPTLAFSGASATVGDEVVISLKIKDNPGLVALELALQYDRDRLTLVKVEDKGLITSPTHTPDVNVYPYMLTWEDGLKPDQTADGVLAELTFQIKETAAAGEAKVWAEITSAYNANLEDLTFVCETGFVRVSDHNWGETDYLWSADNGTCTAKRVCSDEGCSAEETETVNTKAETLPPTCTEDGKTVFTAVFQNEAFESQRKETVGQAALGHRWSNPSYTWSDDYRACTAQRSCTVSGCQEKETEDAEVAVAISPETGAQIFTATFSNAAFVTQIYTGEEQGRLVVATAAGCVGEELEVTVSLEGNPGIIAAELFVDYDSEKLVLKKAQSGALLTDFISGDNQSADPYYLAWDDSYRTTDMAEDGVLVTLFFAIRDDCTVGDEAVITLSGWKAHNNNLDSVSFLTEAGKITVDGHVWSEPTYQWNVENTACTAARVCQMGCGTTEKESAAASMETTAPSCDKDGAITYTAQFENTAFAPQTKVVTGDLAAGHTWGTPVYTWSADQRTCIAERRCTADNPACNGVERETVTASMKVIDASCTVPGKKISTAVFANGAFTTQMCETVITAEHRWIVSGSADGAVIYTCRVCGEQKSNAVSAADPVLRVSDAAGEAGDEVEVTISMENNPGIVSMFLELHYDHKKLSLVTVADQQLLPNGTHSGNLSDNPYSLYWEDSTAAENVISNGVLAKLTFKILDTAEAGNTLVSLQYGTDDIYNYDVENVCFAIDNGMVEVKEKEKVDPQVTFRLIGATQSAHGVDIGKGIDDAEYVTWIAARSYTMPAGSTAYDLIVKALEDTGLSAKLNRTYIRAVTAPAVLGGYQLEEFSNGPRSGWMYSVNEEHVSESIGSYELKDGDSIIVHYINDYRYEDSQWGSSSGGDSQYWDRWLDAPDVDPEEQKQALKVTVAQISDTGTTVTVSNEGSTVTSAIMILAAYDSDGKMVAAQSSTLELPAGGSVEQRIVYRSDDDVSSVKVFLLEPETYQPLMAAVSGA